MNRFDKAVWYAAKELDGVGFLKWLFPKAFVHRDFVCWLDTRGLPFPGESDRICDTVVRLDRSAVKKLPLKATKSPLRL